MKVFESLIEVNRTTQLLSIFIQPKKEDNKSL